ncbi:3'-5' exoribonuclease YhaM family protein [Spiroplasma endosymbiont of Amphibalanus improvisus]|uniref:3'-5' exoribonuclease YhaM family protein n=1 Tax=Spiroplasma endosymbiont of Amphibalanus improvisus TaxID=3066327 RepID=UPI00313A90F7
MLKINELKPNNNVTLVVMCENAITGATDSGQKYINITFKDSTGTLLARIWNASDKDINSLLIGKVYKVRGNILKYRDDIQLRVNNYSVLTDTEYDIKELVPSAPIDLDLVYDEILGVVTNFKNGTYKNILLNLMRDHKNNFKIWPAALKNHHNVIGGLMWHSYTMLKSAIALKPVYHDKKINWELLYAGIILHDMGKVIEISDPYNGVFTVEGKLLGHISIMNAEVLCIAKQLKIKDNKEIALLQHMILSSHGKLEFGSPVLPRILEAEILSFLDNLDARINFIDKAVKKADLNEQTPRLFPAESRWFLNHYDDRKKK